ncbi:MFS transporter [Lysinimonas soli]|uniref:MFS transporter n=1 Tax=Lysinimonas soli TaxID=1074233 RepID=A0ABW0NR12_9MICO
MSHPVPASPTVSAATPRSAWWSLAVLAVAQLMLVLDVTVVNVALPRLSADLGLSADLAGWAIAAYAVPFGGLLLLGGRLADAVGARRMLLIGLGVFIVGSLAAGLSTGVAAYLGARALQGAGGALLSPAALSSLLRRFEGTARRRALAIWGAVGGGGAALGLLVGGLLTGGPGWRWIFFINVPIGIVVAILIPRLLAAVPPVRGRRIGVVPALLATVGLAALIGAASVASLQGGLVSLGLAVVGVIMLGLFVIVERRSPQPLIRPGLLVQRAMATGSLLMLVTTGLLVGSLLLLSFFVQDGLGWSATATGLAFLPIAVALVVGAQGGGHLLGQFGSRRLAPIAAVISAVGLGLAVWAVASEQPVGAIAAITLASIGFGINLVTGSTTALGQVDDEESGSASGAVNAAHEVGSASGAAVFSMLGVALSTASALGWAAAVAVVLAALAVLVLPNFVPAPGEAWGGH